MDKALKFLIAATAVLAIIAACAFGGAAADAVGLWSRVDARIAVEQAQADAALAQARANEREATADLVGERAELVEAEADLLLHEAAAKVIIDLSRRETWRMVRRDVLAAVGILAAIAFCAVPAGAAVGIAAARKWPAKT